MLLQVVSGDVGSQATVGTFDRLSEPVNITFSYVDVSAGIKQNDTTLQVSGTLILVLK